MNTHSWINYKLNLSKLSVKTWLCLGACASKCIHISRVPLKPAVAEVMHNLYLAKGARATTAIEGNTLSEEEVLKIIDKKLELPTSKEYLKDEVANVLEVCNEVKDQIAQDKFGKITIEKILHFNEVILKNVPKPDYVTPGKFRNYSVTVGPYKAPDHNDVPELMNKLCEWLNGEDLVIDKATPISNSIIKAITAHLYIAWIHPFGDGNGRVARILELAILLGSGVPSPAAHLLSNHYNATRNEYYRQLEMASKKSDVLDFFAYAIQGLMDGLKEQLNYIFGLIITISWESYVYDMFGKMKHHDATIKRRRILVLDLSKQNELVKFENLTTLSQKTINEYRKLTTRTLEKDLKELIKGGFVEGSEEGYRAKKETVLAFVPLHKITTEV